MKSDGDKTSKTVAIALTPLDVAAFRDGRPFNAGQMAKSRLPSAQSLAGALRTALMERFGCDFSRFGELMQPGTPYEQALEGAGAPGWIARVAFKGPWLARRNAQGLDVYLPVPANLYREKSTPSKIHCLVPLSEQNKVPGWKPFDDEPRMRPLWPRTKARLERCKGWIGLDGLRRFLAGQSMLSETLVSETEGESLFSFDRRTGIGIDPDALSTQTGLIYAIGFLALAPDVCFYGEMVLPEDAPSDPIGKIEVLAFGGEARRSRIESVERVLWPEAPALKTSQKPFLLLTAPGFWKGGWKPEPLSGRLAGAAVPGHVVISGWDLAKGGPKPSRFGAPAGSVYFSCDELADFPDRLAEENEDRLLGYGTYLKGVWNNG